ncbi:DUF4873 domain-containing protein [Streptomyces physcomitrii]|uniref:DUF4873 domain-containing protein n=1 Tax=Streptomyces physcomitrii TaxID=2724184 RepID=UPI003429C3A3
MPDSPLAPPDLPAGEHGAEQPEEGYRGPARLTVAGAEHPVDVDLRGHFQPIDGKYHWYGRIAADSGLAELLRGKRAKGALRTPYGESEGELADPDLWHRYRITGTGRPPFPVDEEEGGAAPQSRAGDAGDGPG